MLLRTICAFLPLLILTNCGTASDQVELSNDGDTYVLLTHLIGDPGTFHGRRVAVAGYWVWDWDVCCVLAVDPTSGSRHLRMNVAYDTARALAGKYVVVTGTVTAHGVSWHENSASLRVERVTETTPEREQGAIVRAIEAAR